MKKRIIALILTLVMASLTLIGCAYSFAEDDMTKYATFSDETFAAFKDALKKLVIEDGDYTTDPETRQKKVIDSIYSEFASAVKSDGEKKTEGTVGAHDLFYYNYYCTAEFDGATVTLYSAYMKSSSAVNVQLGLENNSEIAKLIADAIDGVDIKDKVYTTETSGSVKEGDVVYVSYTVSQKVEVKDDNGNVETDEEGNPVTKEEKTTVTNERLVLTKDASLLVNHILGISDTDTEKTAATIGTTLDDYTTANGVSYTGIKVNWRSNGSPVATIKNVTYTDTTTATDTNGVSRDLKDKELTYYIYPAYYISVDEFNATNLINVILGEDISEAGIATILIEDYAEKTDEEKKAALEAYSFTSGDGTKYTIGELATTLATLQGDLADAKDALDDAKDDVDEYQEDYDDAKAKVDAAGDAATDAQKDTLSKAETNLADAKEAYTKAETKYNETLADRDAKVAAILGCSATMESELIEGYKRITHEYLLDAYNEEIRMNLASEVYELIEENVTVNSVPEEAVELAYDQLIQNYEAKFYTGTYDSDKGISNYAQYKGDFDAYLIATVTTELKKVENIGDAEAAVMEEAKSIVEPIVRIYTVAAAYGLTVTDDEFDAYKEDESNQYNQNVYYYGESSVLHAYQFDKVMNHILEREENDDGSYTYTGVSYTIGEDVEEEEEGGEDAAE